MSEQSICADRELWATAVERCILNGSLEPSQGSPNSFFDHTLWDISNHSRIWLAKSAQKRQETCSDYISLTTIKPR